MNINFWKSAEKQKIPLSSKNQKAAKLEKSTSMNIPLKNIGTHISSVKYVLLFHC